MKMKQHNKTVKPTTRKTLALTILLLTMTTCTLQNETFNAWAIEKEVIFEDGFEGKVADFWNQVHGTQQISTAIAHSGTSSLSIEGDEGGLVYNFPSMINSQRWDFEVWFYDNMSTSVKTFALALGGNTIVGVFMWSGGDFNKFYGYGNGNGSPVLSSITRSVGWHKATITSNLQNATVFVDDVQLFQTSSPFSFNRFFFGDWWQDRSTDYAYYDDIKVWTYSSNTQTPSPSLSNTPTASASPTQTPVSSSTPSLTITPTISPTHTQTFNPTAPNLTFNGPTYSGKSQFTPFEDTYVDVLDPTSNFGGKTALFIAFSQYHITAVWAKFDLANPLANNVIPENAIIDNATLNIFPSSVPQTFQLTAYFCPSNNWMENEITFMNQPTDVTGGHGTGGDFIVVSSAMKWYSFDVTSYVKDNFNRSTPSNLLSFVLSQNELQPLGNPYMQIDSREVNAGTMYLSVHWTAPKAPAASDSPNAYPTPTIPEFEPIILFGVLLIVTASILLIIRKQ